MRKSKYRQGFTLIELLIVMAIIGMLAALVGPNIIKQFSGTKVEAARAQISSMTTALDAYRLDIGKYPSNLEALIRNSGNSKMWKGPYLRVKENKLPVDPWGNEYHYRKPGKAGRDFDLYSYGADGKEGGNEDDADVY